MKFFRNILDKAAPKFEKGGKLEKYYPIYEMADTFMFTPADVTEKGPHVRDSVDLKRSMIIVVLAMLPAFFFGLFNIGYQEDASRSIIENMLIGLYATLPILLVSYGVGGLWEVIFAVVRKHEINEGFLVTGFLIPMIVPPTTPLWMVAVATSFGVVIGKEIFGGVGMNIFNPALVARAFLFFTYPARISGDKVWVIGPDGYSGATALAVPAAEVNQNAEALLSGVTQFDFSWWNMFIGWIPGSIGETSKLLIIFGALFLAITKIANWRVMAGALLGLFGTAFLTNLMASFSSNTMLSLPGYYHLVMGGFLFGMAFMATEPVTGSHTNKGRWVYGILFGMLTVIVRSINPAYPEGTMLAILLLNAFAPLIDWFVIQGNIKRRVARYAQ